MRRPPFTILLGEVRTFYYKEGVTIAGRLAGGIKSGWQEGGARQAHSSASARTHAGTEL